MTTKMQTRSTTNQNTEFMSLEITNEEYKFMEKRLNEILEWTRPKKPVSKKEKRERERLIKKMCLEKRVFDRVVDDSIDLLHKNELTVDIDFDDASRHWMSNKVEISGGMYKYV